MSLHIVIDGYNLIRQSSRFSAIDQRDLQAGRQALVDALAAYKKIKHYAITVVFDGAAAPSGLVRRDRLKGIDLHFSSMGESADTVIKRLAAKEKQKLLVVSSDSDIVNYAQSQGAAIISAQAFEERLLLAVHAEKEMDGSEPDGSRKLTTRKKGPSRRLPKNRRQMDKRIAKI